MVWLLKRLEIYPNSYYNYKKKLKTQYYRKRQSILDKISELYHDNGGVPGYRMMQELLKEKGIHLSVQTVHRYMNGLLGLTSVTRKKAPAYTKGEQHRKFSNIVNREFTAIDKNMVWLTDFTYIRLYDGSMRYNCTILDLYNREVVATKTGKRIDAQLAVDTLEHALQRAGGKRGILLHSDQGSQYCSNAFTKYCEEQGVLQSMSRAGCPYDNAPMERYFNTLKCELIYQKIYRDEQTLYADILSYAHGWYNNRRPHTYNGGLPPARVA